MREASYPLSPFPPLSRRTASLGSPGMLESHSCTNIKTRGSPICSGSRGIFVCLPVRADKEDGDHARAGVGTDDGADVVDNNILDRGQGADLFGRVFRILDAVAVANENGLLRRVDSRVGQLLREGFERSFPASGLGDVLERSGIIGVHDGLDLQNGADDGRRRIDAAAAL